jgi:hypothetical protein
LEGQAASSSSKDNGNGQDVWEGTATLDIIEGLSLLKKDALQHALTQFGKGDWGQLEITKHLEAVGFKERELQRAQKMIGVKKVTR